MGWARIYLKQDGLQPLFEGAFSVSGEHHHVELQSTYRETMRPEDVEIPSAAEEYMVVYRDSDMVRYVHSELKRSLSESPSCEADKLGFNSDPQHPVFRSNVSDRSGWGVMPVNSFFGLSKRQSDIAGVSGNTGSVNLKSTIGDTAGCPKNKMVALVGVAMDCSLVSSFSSNKAAQQHAINIVNTASSLYEQSFNISLALRNLTTSDTPCPDNAPVAAQWNMPCTSGDITSRLDLFSQWRGSQSDVNAYWTLMSDCPTGAEVGLSWLGQLCNSGATHDGSNTVSGTNIVVRTKAGWQVFAHESGHTFGAVHDCEPQTCAMGWGDNSQCCPFSDNTCSAGGRFIMNPSTSPDVTKFSPCSIGNICSALGRHSVKSGCLTDNHGVVTYTGPKCGNGIVELGEECDCGDEGSCADDPCCDSKTCKFTAGAVCDDSNESCCTNCQFASSSTVCRPSSGECDHEEKCTGNSSSCPSDHYVPDGTKCGPNSSGLKCASGQCTSRNDQCRSLMGGLLRSNDVHSCDSFSCTVTCASSSMPSNECAALTQNFLDGTPCGGGGHCENGQCKGSSTGKVIKSWIDDHLNVVIGIAAGIGGLIVLSIIWCLINRCRRARHARAMAKSAPPVRYSGGWPGAMPGPRPMGPWNSPPGEGYRGINEPPPPPYPGPVYGRYA